MPSPEDLVQLWRIAQQYGMRIDMRPDFQRLPDLLAYDFHREGVVLDVTCPGTELVLRKASSNRAFIHRYSWLLLHNSSYDPTVIHSTLNTTSVLPDSDVVWSFPDNLVDVYRVRPDKPLVLTTLGLPRDSSCEDLSKLWREMPMAATRRKDLKNVYLTAATIITQPQYFKGWSDLHDRQIDTYPKFTYPIMMLCAEDLNFRYNLKQVDFYGEDNNGSFNGLAGLLQRRDVEVGVTSMFMREDRWRVLHYCSETVELVGAFMFRQPAQSAVSNVFALPFSRGVWAASGVVFLAAALLLATITYRLRREDHALQPLSLLECFTFAIGTVCQQGFYTFPSSVSVRVVMVSTLVAALFTFTAYSAKVVAILQAPSDAVRTIADLARSPMALGVQETTYKKVYFAESKDPATQFLYRRKLLPLGDGAYLSVVDGIARMRAGLFAFQVEQGSGYDIISKTFTEHEKCGLKEIQAFKLPMVAVPIVKHCGYRELIASRLRWQREIGVMGRWRRRWLASRPQCDSAAGGFLSVGISDVLPAIEILATGMMIAIILLIGENVIHAALNRTALLRKTKNRLRR
ncbi:glutamate receptor ionotropic, delta-2 [Manduca sexta]|uniref:glutamate receptor ionotropic, delta-2 n=1 Tax=Manduca sexta TaxID=7130 RepID=UPI001890152A|nr:glutamate receptor ionotropic, delta-2 [Manduca sexta]